MHFLPILGMESSHFRSEIHTVGGQRHAKRQVVQLGGHGKDGKAEPRDTFW